MQTYYPWHEDELHDRGAAGREKGLSGRTEAEDACLIRFILFAVMHGILHVFELTRIQDARYHNTIGKLG